MKKLLAVSIIILCSLGFTYAQEGKGIQFESKLNWQQVLAKAKTEHKYIFVDCYATWCAPCRAMDNKTFNDGDVGNVVNKDFVSVQVQIDRTASDDILVKNWYATSQTLRENYQVNAYPTLLFFDSEGRPLHRSLGFLDKKGFLKTIGEAKNPAKQYYRVLRNFKPGKIDTSELKGLAYAFGTTDPALAANLALDYLNRIPKWQLGMRTNAQLMVAFSKDPEIAGIARQYILSIPENKRYTPTMISFISSFTSTTGDDIFRFMYDNAKRINTVMHDSLFTEPQLISIIESAELQPILDAAIKNNQEIDFKVLESLLSKKYNAYYARYVIDNGKITWYMHLINNKHQSEYWKQLAQTELDKANLYYGLPIYQALVNNACYTDIFLHSEDPDLINLGVEQMRKLTASYSQNADAMDTYACLLYKEGRVEEALKVEDLLLQFCIEHKKNGTYGKMKQTILTIQKMWIGEKIWEQKEFQ